MQKQEKFLRERSPSWLFSRGLEVRGFLPKV